MFVWNVFCDVSFVGVCRDNLLVGCQTHYLILVGSNPSSVKTKSTGKLSASKLSAYISVTGKLSAIALNIFVPTVMLRLAFFCRRRC